MYYYNIQLLLILNIKYILNNNNFSFMSAFQLAVLNRYSNELILLKYYKSFKINS